MATLAAAGLAGWIGWRNEVAAVTAAGKPPLTFRSAARHLFTPKAERDAVKQLEALRQRAGRGELTPSEAAECWQIIRNFSEEQVKAYLADLPPEGSMRSANDTLTMMLFQRWVQLDPEVAEREGMKDGAARHGALPYLFLNARISRDPDGAMRWLEANGSDYMKKMGRRMMGTWLVRQDPETGLEKAAALGDLALGAALGEMGKRMAGSTEALEKFYALGEKYGQTKVWDQALSSLGFYAASEDAEALLASVENSSLPPEQAAKMRNRALAAMIQSEPETAMDRAMDPATGIPPERQRSLFSGWAQADLKGAAAWAEGHGRQDFIAHTVQETGTSLVRNGPLHWSERPAGGWTGGVVNRYDLWRAHDRAAAEAWAAAMPADIRAQLNGGKDAHAAE